MATLLNRFIMKNTYKYPKNFCKIAKLMIYNNVKLYNHGNIKVDKSFLSTNNTDDSIKISARFNLTSNKNVEAKIIEEKLNEIVSNEINKSYKNLTDQEFEDIIRNVKQECDGIDIKLSDATIEYKTIYPTFIKSLIYDYRDNVIHGHKRNTNFHSLIRIHVHICNEH